MIVYVQQTIMRNRNKQHWGHKIKKYLGTILAQQIRIVNYKMKLTIHLGPKNISSRNQIKIRKKCIYLPLRYPRQYFG